MINQFAAQVPFMTNPELIGLAKNRFLPGVLQMSIAEHHYRRAHMYLCENSGLTKPTRDYLFSDKCNRGYANKATLIASGHFNGEPSKILEFYNSYAEKMYNRSPWRANDCFIRGSWHNRGQNQSPAEVLNKIFDDRYSSQRRPDSQAHGDYYHSTYTLEHLAKHINCDLGLAIKLSTCGLAQVERAAFAKIVELSK